MMKLGGKFLLCLLSYGCSRTALTKNDCVISEKGKEREQMQMVQ